MPTDNDARRARWDCYFAGAIGFWLAQYRDCDGDLCSHNEDSAVTAAADTADRMLSHAEGDPAGWTRPGEAKE